MKKLFLLLTISLFSLSFLQAQTTLWTEDMESTTADGSLPTGWAREVTALSAGVYNDPGNARNGSNYLNMYNTCGEMAGCNITDEYTFTKAVSMTAGNDYQLTFYSKEGGTATSTGDVYIATGQTSADISGSSLLNFTNDGTYTLRTVDYSCSSTGTYYFAIKSTVVATLLASSYFLMDDFEVTETSGGSGPSASLTPISPSCHGGSDGQVTATVSGGATPYSYTWSNGATVEDITGLGAGIYNLTVTDGAAAYTTATASLTDPDQLSITDEAYTSVTCNGGSDGTLTIMATGGTGTRTYDIGSANNTTGLFTNLAAGGYTATVSDDNGCTATGSTQTIPEPSAIGYTTITTTDVATCGGSDGEIHITGSGGTGTLNYDDGSTSNTTGDFTSLSAGNYTITITDGNSCKYESPLIKLIETNAPVITDETADHISCHGQADGQVSIAARAVPQHTPTFGTTGRRQRL